MAEPEGSLIRLEQQDIQRAAAMLGRAFFHDPKMTHLIPEISARADRSQYLFEFHLRYGLIYGDVYTTSPTVEGVAVWLPSEQSEVTFWRAFRAGGFRLQNQLGPEVMNRLLAFAHYIDDLHKKHIPEPHSYLFFIGVDPSCQGKGHAGRLIRPMLRRLDERKLPCYLNTQNEKNVSMYEYLGFRIIDRHMVPGSAILHTAMRRDPHPVNQ